MSVVEEFDRLVSIAQDSGYRVRYDYFGGTGGGICQFGGAQWVFVDLALSVIDRLDQLKTQLAADSHVASKLESERRAA